MRVEVTFGSDPEIVTIHLSTTSRPIVAGLLGVDLDDAGNVDKVYIRQLIHKCNDDESYEGWSMSGAVSTVLTRVHAS